MIKTLHDLGRPLASTRLGKGIQYITLQNVTVQELSQHVRDPHDEVHQMDPPF